MPAHRHRSRRGRPGRRPVLCTAALTLCLAVVLVALTWAWPASALRSGPDVGVHLDVGIGADSERSDDGEFVPPVAGIDPPSGVVHLFDPPGQEWGAGHRGVDLATTVGASVLSPGAGVVTFVGRIAHRGVVVVTHPGGLRTSLEPVDAAVSVGTTITAGAAVGVVEAGSGSSGGSTPNHCAPDTCVHWGVRRGERYIDPLSLLDRPPIVLLPGP